MSSAKSFEQMDHHPSLQLLLCRAGMGIALHCLALVMMMSCLSVHPQHWGCCKSTMGCSLQAVGPSPTMRGMMCHNTCSSSLPRDLCGANIPCLPPPCATSVLVGATPGSQVPLVLCKTQSPLWRESKDKLTTVEETMPWLQVAECNAVCLDQVARNYGVSRENW